MRKTAQGWAVKNIPSNNTKPTSKTPTPPTQPIPGPSGSPNIRPASPRAPLDLSTNKPRRLFEKEFPFIKREIQLTPESPPANQEIDVQADVIIKQESLASPGPYEQPPQSPRPIPNANTFQGNTRPNPSHPHVNEQPGPPQQNPHINLTLVPLWIHTKGQLNQVSLEIRFLTNVLSNLQRWEDSFNQHLPPHQRLALNILLTEVKTFIRRLYLLRDVNASALQNLLASIRYINLVFLCSSI